MSVRTASSAMARDGRPAPLSARAADRSRTP